MVQFLILFMSLTALTAISPFAHANPACEALLDPALKAQLEELVGLAAKGEISSRYQELLEAYSKATGLSASDVKEAVAMQAELRAAQVAGNATDESLAEQAYAYAREKVLVLPGALMSAIEEGRDDLVRGFLAIHQRQDEICQNVPGYSRYCKDLNLADGWKGKSFLIAAANSSKEVAQTLVTAGMTAPLEKLPPTTFGADVATWLIQGGATLPFAKALDLADLSIAFQLLRKGHPFTIGDLIFAIQKGDKTTAFVEEALALYPLLAHESDKGGRLPLNETIGQKNKVLFELLLAKYKVNPNSETDKMWPALFEAVVQEDKAFFDRLIDSGANLRHLGSSGWSLAHTIVRHMNSSSDYYLSELILGGANLNSQYNKDLHLAGFEPCGKDATPYHLLLRRQNQKSSEFAKLRELFQKNDANL